MRERYLYETKNAGVGASGPTRDLYQERLELSGIAGTTYEPYKRRSHHRTQHCTMDSEGVIRLEPGKTGIEGRPLPYKAEDSWEPSKAGDERLGWSTRPTSAPVHSHGVSKLYFHLEDDSLAVVELSEENSGLTQGRIVRRHQVPFKEIDPDAGPRLMKSKFITMWDLNVGVDINIYGKIFTLVECDEFTRHFLSCQGVSVPPEVPIPASQYAGKRSALTRTEPRKPYKKINTLSQFLENDGQVLRFSGLWDDGLDKRKLNLMYFLADDTIQINEKHPESGGRYKAPILLRRTKIPKEKDLLVAIPGTFNEKTILNVVTTPGTGRRKKNHLISDNRDLSARVIQYYDASDLSVGATVNICGKEIFLYDCDNFTREYYKVKYDQDQLNTIEVEVTVHKTPVRPVPPYTGLGTEEDSLTSWLGGNSLEPKPPTRDFFKFQKLDRFGYDSHVLRFSARLIVKGEIDKNRKFVISYYLADDQIQINVLPERGSGIKPGKFIEKARMRKPKKDQPSDPAIHSNYYSAQDIYVGAMLEVQSHLFLITAADDYVFDFMERDAHREQFSHSNIRAVTNKVAAKVGEKFKSLMARFMRDDPTDTGTVSESVFRSVLDEFVGFDLSEHEVITILRKYRVIATPPPDSERERVRALLQADLRGDNFSQYDKVLLSLQQADVSGGGHLERQDVRRVLLSSLGLTRSQQRTQTVRHLMDAFLKTYPDTIDYAEVVHELNWIKNPARPICPGVIKVQTDSWQRATPAKLPVEIIQYRTFMDDLSSKV